MQNRRRLYRFSFLNRSISVSQNDEPLLNLHGFGLDKRPRKTTAMDNFAAQHGAWQFRTSDPAAAMIIDLPFLEPAVSSRQHLGKEKKARQKGTLLHRAEGSVNKTKDRVEPGRAMGETRGLRGVIVTFNVSKVLRKKRRKGDTCAKSATRSDRG